DGVLTRVAMEEGGRFSMVLLPVGECVHGTRLGRACAASGRGAGRRPSGSASQSLGRAAPPGGSTNPGIAGRRFPRLAMGCPGRGADVAGWTCRSFGKKTRAGPQTRRGQERTAGVAPAGGPGGSSGQDLAPRSEHTAAHVRRRLTSQSTHSYTRHITIPLRPGRAIWAARGGKPE